MASIDQSDAKTYKASPDSEGRFEIVDVSAGEYILSASAVGFMPNQVTLSVEIGRPFNVGVLSLAHRSQTINSVWFRGHVLLNDDNFHGGTSVQLKFIQDNQSMIQLQTDAAGLFTAQVSPDEPLEINIARAGYITPTTDTLGVFTFSEDLQNFVDSEGGPLSVTLTRAPIEGQINIPLEISPKWIPAEQRFARISLIQIDGNYRATIDAAEDQEIATFSDLPAGRYLISASRAGFSSVDLPLITVDEDTTEVTAEPIVMELNSLAESNIDLDGHTIDACALRSSPVRLESGDFSGATLTGSFGPITGADGCEYCTSPQGDEDTCAALSLAGSNLTNVSFDTSTALSPASLRGALMSHSNFFGAQMLNVDASGADLKYTNFFGIDGRGAQFDGANLQSANFSNAQLQEAQFAQSVGDHLDEFEFEGQLYPHPWAGLRRPLSPLIFSPCKELMSDNLKFTNFAQANLSDAFLVGVNLSEAILADAIIVKGDLRGSCLKRSSLNLTDMTGATLDGADLTDAVMINTVLHNTRLRGVNLKGATLTSAIIEQALFSPMPLTIYGEEVDQRCRYIPSWSDYYPDLSFDSNAPSNCDDALDNDGDGYTDLEDPGCLGEATGAEDQPACVAEPSDQAPSCHCRTSLVGANLNGANLVGARFDGADLSNSSLLGLTVGSSLKPPVSRPYECDLLKTESCFNLCPLVHQYINTAGMSCDGSDIDLSENVPQLDISCLEWRDLCVQDILPIPQVASFRSLQCLYMAYSSDHELCSEELSNSESPFSGDQGQRCLNARDAEAEIDRMILEDPAVASTKCSFESIQATLQEESEGRTCEVDENDPLPWACCPRSMIPLSCTKAKTSFVNSRLANAQMTGANFTDVSLNEAILTGAHLVAAQLSNSSLNGAILEEANLRGADLSKLDLTSVNLRGVDASNSSISDVLLGSADLAGALFNRASLFNVLLSINELGEGDPPPRFNNARLLGRQVQNDNQGGELNNLYDLRLPNSEFKGIHIENLTFNSGDLTNSDFSNGTIIGVSFKNEFALNGINMTRATLANVTFRGSKNEDDGDDGDDETTEELIEEVRQIGGLATGEDSKFLQLTGSDFSFAYLREANNRRLLDARTSFDRVNLSNSLFNGTHLRNVDFKQSYLANVIFSEIYGEVRSDWNALLFKGGGMSGELSGLGINTSILDGFDLKKLNIEYKYINTSRVENSIWSEVTLSAGSDPESSISQVQFYSLQLDRVEFSDTALNNVEFEDLRIEKAIPFFAPSDSPDATCRECGEGSLCLFGGSCIDEQLRCVDAEDCEGGASCFLGVCTALDFPDPDPFDSPHLTFNNSSLDSVTFTHVRGSSLSFLDVSLLNTQLNNIVIDQLNLDDVTIENSSISLLDANQTSIHDTDLSGIKFEHIHHTEDEACGSRLNLEHYDGVIWAGAILTGLCDEDLDQILTNQDLEGTFICDRHQAGLTEFTGTPNWVNCPTVYCPDHILCTP